MAFAAQAARLAASALVAGAVAAVVLMPVLATGGVCFDRIFSFGDSLTDTGNFLLSVPDDFPDPARSLPYGQTFFGRPSGRYSDGRNLLDFFGKNNKHRETYTPSVFFNVLVSVVSLYRFMSPAAGLGSSTSLLLRETIGF